MRVAKWRKLLYNFFLKKKLKTFSADRKNINFDKVNSIAIIFNATNAGNSVVVNNFAARLRKMDKRVELLGYFHYNRVEGDLNFPYFHKKDLNIYFHPKNDLDHFLNKPFDLLVNAYVEENLPLEYISTFSNAKFRVGLYRKGKTYYADWMVQSKEAFPSLESLLEEFYEYLNKIYTYEYKV